MSIVKNTLKQVLTPEIIFWLRAKGYQITSTLPDVLFKYGMYKRGTYSYVIPKSPPPSQEQSSSGLAVPSHGLGLGYGDTKEEYLSRGEEEVKTMIDAATASGFSFSQNQRILDFGCGKGRLLRHFKHLAESSEIWGLDVYADEVYWCKQYLDPPFNFATTTTIPHLPFTDGYFDFIYAGSVFTHLDDLAEAWFLELRRVLSPSGRLYVTIQDNHTIKLLNTTLIDSEYSQLLRSSEVYQQYKDDFGMIVIGRDTYSQIFYDIDYFRQILRSMFDIISVIPEAYGWQTGVLLQKK